MAGFSSLFHLFSPLLCGAYINCGKYSYCHECMLAGLDAIVVGIVFVSAAWQLQFRKVTQAQVNPPLYVYISDAL